jgi:hypothetical protein
MAGIFDTKQHRGRIMQTLLRTIAVAAVVAFSSILPSKAAMLVPPGPFSAPGGTGFFANSITEGFTDDIVFTIVGPGVFNASFSTTNAFTAGNGFIEGFTMSLYSGSPPVPGTGLLVPSPGPSITPDVSQTIAFSKQLTAGTYFLHFSGTGVTGDNPAGDSATYGGSVSFFQASATPLPGAMPLFLSGFGAMGLLVWQRKRRVAAAV